MGLLLLFGLLLGLGSASTIGYYAHSDPDAVWEAGAATALFIAGFGAAGYATRRDLSRLARTLLWALVGLITFGIVLVFVQMPGGALIYSIAGLVIFAGLTLLDFQRLRSSDDMRTAPPAGGFNLPRHAERLHALPADLRPRRALTFERLVRSSRSRPTAAAYAPAPVLDDSCRTSVASASSTPPVADRRPIDPAALGLAYLAGSTLAELSKRHRVSESTIKRLLRELGTRKHRRMTADAPTNLAASG